MNPCPCGEGGTNGHCRCSDAARARYSRRLSGPLLDRFDLRLEVHPPAPAVLLGGDDAEPSNVVAERVAKARQRAKARGVRCNADLLPAELDEVAPVTSAARQLLKRSLERGELTGRGLRRVRTVARTIADLRDDDEFIDVDHLQAALTLRNLPKSVLGVAS